VYSHLQGLEKIILFPFKCDGQVSQGHFSNVLALWVRSYNLSRKEISPFTDSLEGCLFSEKKTRSQSAIP